MQWGGERFRLCLEIWGEPECMCQISCSCGALTVLLPLSCQDRVLIGRIELVCQAVLSGKWPSAQQIQGSPCIAQGEGLTRLHGEYTSTPIPHICPLVPPEEVTTSFPRLRHSGQEKEFTVQIKDVSGKPRMWIS